MKYRVYATCTSHCFLDVEAKTLEEALNIAAEADGGDFITHPYAGEFEITHADELGK